MDYQSRDEEVKQDENRSVIQQIADHGFSLSLKNAKIDDDDELLDASVLPHKDSTHPP